MGNTSKKKSGNKSSEKNSIKELQPSLISALQDPSSIQPVADTIKRNVPSHKAPVLCIKWFPTTLELDMKKSYALLGQMQGPVSEINQFASISSDGQILLWDKKFLDAQKKPITDVLFFRYIVNPSRMEGRLWIPFIQTRRWRSNGRVFYCI